MQVKFCEPGQGPNTSWYRTGEAIVTQVDHAQRRRVVKHERRYRPTQVIVIKADVPQTMQILHDTPTQSHADAPPVQFRRSTPSGSESAALKASSAARSVPLPGGCAGEADAAGLVPAGGRRRWLWQHYSLNAEMDRR